LLRHAASVSPLSDLSDGEFRRIIADDRPDQQATSRVLLCSGKVYFDLSEYRAQQGRDDVAIVRIEQLYPFRDDVLRATLERYDEGTRAVWIQEEPENMGAWRYWKVRFGHNLLGRFPFDFVARPESASTATGSKSVHKREQHELIEKAFGSRTP